MTSSALTRTGAATAALLLLIAGASVAAGPSTRTAVFAGGCYWTMQHDMAELRGVVAVRAGFAPFAAGDPVAARPHRGPAAYEAVQVTFDPRRISYRQLVRRYFRLIDPTDAGGAFCDRGPNYRSAIFAEDPSEAADARAEKDAAAAILKRPVVTTILSPTGFHPAPPEQQNWARTHAQAYATYRAGCGKDRRIKALWDAAPAL